MIKDELEKLLGGTVQPSEDLTHGDYTTNLALVSKADPQQLVAKILANKPPWLEKIEIAGPGFINFYLAPAVFSENLQTILDQGDKFGHSNQLAGQKIIVEYTDPNPFKEFHIGHLMSNTVGESISRLVAANGAEVKHACYQGDVGLHVAKAVWGKQRSPDKSWGEAYVVGSQKYEDDQTAKQQIIELNKTIYERSDEAVNTLYDEGKKISLERFEEIYKKLCTKFDFYFFESETGEFGKQVVESNLGKFFEKSNGAIVFHGELYGLHTRVFINSEGLPTYEAKELGLAKIKYDRYAYDQSIVVTGNEIVDYFRVLLAAMTLVFPDLAAKTKHLPHGMLRLTSGKMSSRTGDIITGESLLQSVIEKVKIKMVDRGFGADKLKQIAEQVAVAAIKYSILKQAPGRDIIFDEEKSLALEGDSGPYLQYAYVRARSILKKASYQNSPINPPHDWIITPLERLLIHFPNVVSRAMGESAPQTIITYLLALASTFNAYYATEPIIGSAQMGYKLALTSAVATVLRNGLWLLGISAPEEM